MRFRGRVAPAHKGLLVVIQWLGPHGHWHAVKFTRLRGAVGGVSVYSVRLRVQRDGRYRVVVRADAGHARGLSRTVRLRWR